tara:strand:+ start:5597 stop:6019 length:423 start_codon:yes stop_codon:yes gene_type:complete
MSLDFRLNEIVNYRTLCWRDDKTMNPVTENLIWATMNVGIGHIRADNVDEFFTRLQITEFVYGKSVYNPDTNKSLLTYDAVTAHVGLSTNATRLNKRAFKEKMWQAVERIGNERLKWELRDQKVRASTGASVPPSVELSA